MGPLFAVPDSAATEVVAVSLLSRAVSHVACFSFKAIDWIACRDAEEIRRDREARFHLEHVAVRVPSHAPSCRQAMIVAVEKAGQKMKGNQLVNEWMSVATSETRAVAGDANGPLLEQLLRVSNHLDLACAELLRSGVSHAWSVLAGRYCSTVRQVQSYLVPSWPVVWVYQRKQGRHGTARRCGGRRIGEIVRC